MINANEMVLLSNNLEYKVDGGIESKSSQVSLIAEWNQIVDLGIPEDVIVFE